MNAIDWGAWSLRWPFAIAVVAILAATAAAWAWRRARRDAARREGAPAVWHLESLVGEGGEAGEEAGRLWRAYRALCRAAVGLVVALAALAALLAARPSTVDRAEAASSSRDIVLCLDVSGSTLPYDREVISAYLDLVGRFQGERIALSIFNSTSRTVFPLTDDYDLVTAQLSAALDVLKGVQTQDDIDHMTDKEYQSVSDWLEGTQNRKDATSLIGDGLVSCASLLPSFTASGKSGSDGTASGSGALDPAATGTSRPASIVLATDNVLSGTPLYTLDEALSLAQASGIAVDGLYSGDASQSKGAEAEAMRTSIEAHGGQCLKLSSGDSIAALVRSIESRKAGERERSGHSDRVDAPQWLLLAFAVVFAAYLAVAGRLGR